MIKIITDSTCALPPDFLTERNIPLVHLKVNFGDTESYDELTGITNEEFYRRITTDKTAFPSTSQPAAGEFKTVYETIAAPGDELLVITLSGKLSGTFNSAQTAAKLVSDIPVTIFDSQSLALGLGLMVATASDMALAGKSMDEILARLEHMRLNMRIFFVVDTLEYLRRGGRIGAASAFLGSILNIKPILSVTDGVLQPFDRVRSKRKALARIIKELRASVPNPEQPVQLGVMHAAAPDEMDALEAQVLAAFPNIVRTISGEISPVLGSHGGPGLLGAGICPEPEA